MSTAAQLRLITPAEYLAFERQAERKHEYRDGQIVMMPGASRPHCKITGNLFLLLHQAVSERGCEIYMLDLRVCVSPEGLYTYPDLVVVCGEAAVLDNWDDTLLNPSLLVEVLSPSTESYDRGVKFEHYKEIATLREYVLVSQDRMRVERFLLEEGEWKSREWAEPGDMVRFESIACDVPLAAIYANVPRLRQP